MTPHESKSVGEDFPNQQARIQRCIENGLEIGPAGGFYVAMARDLLRRSQEAAMSGDVVAQVAVYQEMTEFAE